MKIHLFLILLVFLSKSALCEEIPLADIQQPAAFSQKKDDAVSFEQDDKQCMMICIKWEQACLKNDKTGTENCRRMCKDFGEHCY